MQDNYRACLVQCVMVQEFLYDLDVITKLKGRSWSTDIRYRKGYFIWIDIDVRYQIG